MGFMKTSIRPHDQFRLKIDRIGHLASPVVVIDNFIQNAEELRQETIAEAQFRPVAPPYPGLRAPVPLPYPLSLYQLLRGVIGDVFGLAGKEAVDSQCTFALVTRRAAEMPVRQRVPHSDSVHPDVIVVLHYLFHGAFGGTSFYRHRKSGIEVVSAENKPAYEKLLAEELDRQPPKEYIDGDTDLFERIACYPALFNRALIYRSANLHNADIGENFTYDPSPDSGRLTVNTSLLFGQQAVISLRRG